MTRNREFSTFKRRPHHGAGHTLVSDTSDDRHDGARDGFINSRTRFHTHVARARARARALSHTRESPSK